MECLSEHTDQNERREHRRKVNNEVKSDLMTLGLDRKLAEKVVIAMANDKIRNVNIEYEEWLHQYNNAPSVRDPS
jgi:predicted transcriptional regulator